MSGTDDKEVGGTGAGGNAFVPSRRTVLVLGAAAASTVVTVRPALAQTAGSVLNCEIPVPGPMPAATISPPTAIWSRPARPARRRRWRGRCAARRRKAAAARHDARPASIRNPLRPMPITFGACSRG